MKKLFQSLAIVAAIAAAPAFAADLAFDATTLATGNADAMDVLSTAGLDLTALDPATAGTFLDSDTAVIMQVGTNGSSMAIIDQVQGGSGTANLAVIIQGSDSNPAVAMIQQVGPSNTALIHQHD